MERTITAPPVAERGSSSALRKVRDISAPIPPRHPRWEEDEDAVPAPPVLFDAEYDRKQVFEHVTVYISDAVKLMQKQLKGYKKDALTRVLISVQMLKDNEPYIRRHLMRAALLIKRNNPGDHSRALARLRLALQILELRGGEQ